MILFRKMDFIKEKRTTCAREHSLCLCGTDSGFGLQISAYNRHVFCIELLAFKAYTATYIYIFEVYEYIDEYRCTFSKKKKFVCHVLFGSSRSSTLAVRSAFGLSLEHLRLCGN